MTAIFDSLTHPTLTGKPIGGGQGDASFEKLSADLKAAGFEGACAVGLAGVENYEHEAFLAKCRNFPEFVPVAGVHPGASTIELDRVKSLGFAGIKIHSRFSRVELSAELLGKIFQAAEARDLPVFYCTYMHSKIDTYPTEDPFYVLVRALRLAPNARVVLLHGGDVELLRYAELVRFNPNLLLDLSFTMLKYVGSRLDFDLQFLFSNLDRRICVGSDHPEFQPADMKKRFEELVEGLAEEKQENIAAGNIRKFLKLNQ